LEKRIYIPLPELEARAHLLKASMKNTPNELVDTDYMELAHKTEMLMKYFRFSGADLSILVRDACF
jgi:vacuolar protein-sorting-associated protein 4